MSSLDKIILFFRKYLFTKRNRVEFVYPVLIFFLLICSLDLLFPLPATKPWSKVIYAADGSILSVNLSEDSRWRIKVHFDEISPDMTNAIIAKEDSWYRWHLGINPVSVVRAAVHNLFSRKRTLGASTISMQVARMLNPSPRTVKNKLIEMFRAVQLELHYSKDEILEMYLNLLPYGGNIEGVKAASFIYFNRLPGKLSLSQSIILTIIPNNPNRLRPDRNSAQILNERNKWVKIFSHRNLFPEGELKDALEEPIPQSRFKIKIQAPVFSRFIARKFREKEIRTTLQPSVQLATENILSGYIERVKSKGVSNGAVIIIDNNSNSVVGYCGSENFNDSSSLGQVNGITALRSPGSSLKPALYAMAFDDGILTPSMRLTDIPTNFDGYEPENFDQKFRGYVKASYALVNSLNIPAVQLLQQTGYGKFIALLDKAGFTEISKNKTSLGLSMILGGCSVKLEQLTRLYTAFAHNGNLYDLNYLKNQTLNNDKAVKLFSPGASYIIVSILSAHQRPDFPNEFLYSTNLPHIAWKTGTSFGKRDAWAIGFNPDYTIGVWLGNFNGEGASDLSGVGFAVPLLFELFNNIDFNPKKIWFDKPDDLLERDVCSETGLLPSENCTNTEKDFYINKTSPNLKCDLYRPVYVNQIETIQYCTGCLPDSGYKKVFYPFYPPELAVWFEKNNVQYNKPPPHNPNCQAVHFGEGPQILSPTKNFEYLIEGNNPQQIMLQAASDPSVKELFWYIGDKFFRKSLPGDKLFLKPGRGISKIICMDDLGRKSAVSIKVTFY